MIRIALALALVALSWPARAASVVTGLSQDQIQISSTYTGTEIAIFGVIEGADYSEDSRYDVAVVLRGPDTDMVVRKKDRVAGLWINRDQARLGLPAFYYLAASRPLDAIAPAFTLDRYGVGLQNLRADRIVSHHDPEPFRKALIRQLTDEGLYQETFTGVEFLSNMSFRVRVPIPAGVARGQYNAEVYLFRNGAVEAAQSTPLFIDQIGMERRIFNLAHQWPIFYGLAAVLMAGLLGWLSSIVFRRPM
jgi:uncharacterized protein (TIGR02186 family)